MRVVSNSGSQAPAWEPTVREAPASFAPKAQARACKTPRSQAGAWERAACVIVLLAATHPAIAEDSPSPAATQFQTLVHQYNQEGGATLFAKRFLALAEEQPQDPAALDALLWIVENVRGRSETTRALELLKSTHVDSQRLGPACGHVARSHSLAAEALLRALLEKNPHVEVKAQACYYLALLLDSEATIVDQLKAEPDLAPRVLQYYGRDYGKHLASLDADELANRRERVYETMLKSFPSVTVRGTTLDKVAEQALFGIRHLAVGRIAPDIQGEDIFGKEFKLSDYRGKVVMLTFWGHW